MKNKTKKLVSTLLALVMVFGLFAAMPMTASADATTGLTSFSAEPAANANFAQVTAHPFTKISTGANFYRISYDRSLPAIDFELLFAVDQAVLPAGAVFEFEWALYWVNPVNDTPDGTPFHSGAESSDSKKLKLPDGSIGDGKYEVRGHLQGHNGWLKYRIEVIRTSAVTVLKVDDKGKPLPGATITITDSDGAVYEAVTDGNGIADFSVPDGSYTVSESKAPASYQGTDKTYGISVTPNGVFVTNPSKDYPDYPISFVNAPATGGGKSGQSFTVKKTGENGLPLAGATLRLEGKTEDGFPYVSDVVTDSNGEAVFTAADGTYALSEYAAPAGYNATDETYNIIVTPNGVYIQDPKSPNSTMRPYEKVTFVNKKIIALNPDDHFAYMQGYPEGDFRPGGNMTRAEAVVMFSRLLAESMDLTANYINSYYPDVDPKKWYANQICYMQQKGVLAHYSRNGKFCPDEPVTRAEFATLAAHFDNLTLTSTNIFTDVADDHWAVKYINSAAAKGWIVGYSDHTFKPEAFITRAEVVTLVNRILGRKADQNYINANLSSLPRSYSDITSAYWAYWEIMEASIGHDFTKQGTGEKWTAFYNSK